MFQEKKTLLIIFGGTGDLAKRKLYPSLFRLYRKGLLNKHFAIIGTARRVWTNDHYRQVVQESLRDLDPTLKEATQFASHFYYQAHDATATDEYINLKQLADQLDQTYQIGGNRLFYLAMAPSFFGTITQHLSSEKIISEAGYNRLIIEKPFGTDYQSAKQLNDEIRSVFPEKQIFRIDHYLGKEMIQNISAIRFSNHLFEAMWNNRHIDHIQVTLSESLGVEERGGYYDHSGALKDMIQNHALQVVSLLAMEPPRIFSEAEIRREKINALRSIRVYNEEEAKEAFVRGQYGSGQVGKERVCGYREEPNVAYDSQTETYAAGKLMIDNFRWAGVPFYIRSGKRLAEKGTRINVVFKEIPVNIFSTEESGKRSLEKNMLTIYIQPTEGFALTINGKQIGSGFELESSKMDFRHSLEMMENSPEAYEKLILDCMEGDATNFTHWDEVAASWKIVDVVRAAWDCETVAFPNYPAGSMGPKEADDLLMKDGNYWIWRPEEWYQKNRSLNAED